MTALADVNIPAPGKQFLDDAVEGFEAQLRQVVKHKTYRAFSKSHNDWFVSSAINDVKTWLNKEIPKQPQRWDAHVRVIRALQTAATNGTMVLSSPEDAKIFQYVTASDFASFPSMIEHYVQTRELFEVLKMAMDTDDIGARSKHSRSSDALTASLVVFRIKLLRLYFFDMSIESEAVDEVPLGIRMGFSGFDEGITDDEIRGDRRLRREDSLTEDQVLPSFQEMMTSGYVFSEEEQYWYDLLMKEKAKRGIR